MNAFESLVSMLLRHQGYWTIPNFKVSLTKEEKRQIGRISAPRWEVDLVAYKGATNEILVIECKSYLDSKGVLFVNGEFNPPTRYKLFSEPVLREIVINRMVLQLESSGLCSPKPHVTLCLAAGNISQRTDRDEMNRYFQAQSWLLWGPDGLRERLLNASTAGYENDVAFVVSKVLLRERQNA